MRTRLLAIAALVAVVLLSPIGSIEACGPWFEDDVFVNVTRPDDAAAFAKGQLGILQARFDSNEYAIAYRYLNGGKLSDAERDAYAPPINEPQPAADYRNFTPEQIAAAQEAEKQAQENAQPFGKWLRARARFIPAGTPGEQKPVFATNYDGTIALDEGYLNCPDPAFTNATLTLANRADTWGRTSSSVIDWIHAQDAVFANCASKIVVMPTPASANSSALFKADRAYQIASATFYAKQFDEAARQFAAIAADGSSPWAAWGAYLAARATVRKAFAMGKATDPYSGDVATYDQDTMMRAQQMLESLLKQPDPKPSRAILQDELNFIRIRTQPEKRVAEICTALAGPAPDPNFTQDMRDLSWTLSKHLDINNPAPLLSWIEGWRGAGTAATAFGAWQRTSALPWLAMAMAKAGPDDSFVPDLLDAASKIIAGTPAYDTVFFHRVRLLISVHRTDEARMLLDAALPAMRKQKPSSNLNALLHERMAVSRNFEEFLLYAPRTTLETASDAADDLRSQCEAKSASDEANCHGAKQLLEFDDDAATVLNQHLPMKLLIEAANSPSVSPDLRQNIAIVAWTRAVLFDDAQSTAKLSPLLPKALRETAGSSASFPADLAILQNPGVHPYLESGVPRVASYNYLDQFRNNWWCKPWTSRQDPSAKPSQEAETPPFIPPPDEFVGRSEYQRLQQMPDSVSVIGQRVVDYAVAHPDDPLVPEALSLTVRAGHYACQSYNPEGNPGTSQYTQVSKAAFELLHRRYSKSPWALKTRYYY
jgi:hypothetical protein